MHPLSNSVHSKSVAILGVLSIHVESVVLMSKASIETSLSVQDWCKKNSHNLHLALYVDFTHKEREFIMGNNNSKEKLLVKNSTRHAS